MGKSVFFAQRKNSINMCTNGDSTLYRWRTDVNEAMPIWHSKVIYENPDKDVQIKFQEVAVTAIDHGDKTYIGLNNGLIKIVYGGAGFGEIKRFPSLEDVTQAIDERDKGASPHTEGTVLDWIFRGGFQINSLVSFNDKLYDASALGLYCDTARIVSKSVAHSGVYIGKLGMLWNALTIDDKLLFAKREEFSWKGAENLYDVFTGDVIAQDIAPNDGSGYKRGDFVVSGDKIYMFHGDWPCECMTVKSFPEGKLLEERTEPNPSMVRGHKGKIMYVKENEIITVYGEKILSVPKEFGNIRDITSADESLLLSVYNRDTNLSSLLNAQKPKIPLMVLEGKINFVGNSITDQSR